MTTPRAKPVELMLLGWSESHNGGCKLTFAVSEEDLDWFRTMTVAKGKMAGQRIMAAMVEIGPDEKPVTQPEPKKHHGGKFPDGLAGLAVRWCLDEHFQHWMMKGFNWLQAPGDTAEEVARGIILEVCEISSRNELNTNRIAADTFEAFIRVPYSAQRKEDGLNE